MIITPLSRIALLRLLPKNGVVAEIGVDNGGFAGRIVQLNEPSKLHLIDPWGSDDDEYVATYGRKGKSMEERFQAVTTMFEGEVGSGQVVIHRDYSHSLLPNFPDHHFDWVFVDGMHTYEAVVQDLQVVDRTVKPDGFIAGHDFSNTGRESFGVIKAVQEFIAARPGYEVLVVTHEPAPTYVISKAPTGEIAQKFRHDVIAADSRVIDVPLSAFDRFSQEWFNAGDNRKHTIFRFH